MGENFARCLETGQLDRALEAVMTARSATPSDDAPAVTGLLCDEAEVHLLAGDAEAAFRAADQAIALAQPLALKHVLVRACLIRAQVELAHESATQARAHVTEAFAHVADDTPPGLRGLLHIVAARLSLLTGDLAAAGTSLIEAEKLVPRAQELLHGFLLARSEFLIAQRKWSDAEARITQVLRDAERHGKREALWAASWLMARIARERGALKEAKRWRERAVNVISETAAALPADLAQRYISHPVRVDVLEGGDAEAGLAALLESNDSALLARIVDIVAAMNSETEPSRLLTHIVDTMLELCNARRGMLLLTRADGPTIEVARHRDGRTLTEDEVEYSRSVILEVARTGKPLLITNAPADVRFSGTPSVSELDLRSVMCLPLTLRRRQIGVIYLDNNLVTHAFHEREMNAARILANQAAIALEHAMLLSGSVRDVSTGLLTQAHFQGLLRNEVNRARRGGRVSCVAIASLDQYRSIHEKYGDGVGSQLLTDAARLLCESVRSYDVVGTAAKLGRHGNVFELLLPDTTKEGLGAVAERILQSFRGHIFTIGPNRISVTMTLGAACCPDDGTEADELVARAEEALMRAIEEGRDRLRTYSEKKSDAAPVVAAQRPRRDYPGIVGKSRALQQLLTLLDRVVEVDYPAVIEGETGVGKELIAHAIHLCSPRRDAPFVAVNCAALSETLLEDELFGHVKGAYTGAHSDRPGLFEQAQKGTLFLDEVEEMSDAMQKKLLRCLEEKKIRRVGGAEEIPVDVRVVAATNRELKTLVARGEFRKDLFYRLSTFILRVPPLRERADDIPLLIEHTLEIVARETGQPKKTLSGAARSFLIKYPWPGNVRELQNEVRRLCITSNETILESDLPAHLRDSAVTKMVPTTGTYRERLESFEKRLLLEALQEQGWNLSATARALEIDRNTLKAKMQRYGVERPDSLQRPDDR
jgi:diguanylate cyclase (GGDEF)-like protein